MNSMRYNFIFLFLFIGIFSFIAFSQNPTEREQELYDVVMAYRKSKGLPVIPLSPKLTKVAQLHCVDLMKNPPDEDNGCNMHSWGKSKLWKACCYGNGDDDEGPCMWDKPKEIAGYEGAGYEIAFFSSGDFTAKLALESWKKSPGHHNVIINKDIWKEMKWGAIGVGIQGNYAVIWFGVEPD